MFDALFFQGITLASSSKIPVNPCVGEIGLYGPGVAASVYVSGVAAGAYVPGRGVSAYRPGTGKGIYTPTGKPGTGC